MPTKTRTEARANYEREYRKRDPEKWKQYHREYMRTYKATIRAEGGPRLENLKTQVRKYKVAGWKKRREQILAMLGNKCVRCGFDDTRALQIDHINGGGTKERRSFGSNNETYYRRILASGGEGYQLLCANCNAIKRFLENEG